MHRADGARPFDGSIDADGNVKTPASRDDATVERADVSGRVVELRIGQPTAEVLFGIWIVGPDVVDVSKGLRSLVHTRLVQIQVVTHGASRCGRSFNVRS